MKRTVWMMAAVGIVLLGLAACGSAAPESPDENTLFAANGPALTVVEKQPDQYTTDPEDKTVPPEQSPDLLTMNSQEEEGFALFYPLLSETQFRCLMDEDGVDFIPNRLVSCEEGGLAYYSTAAGDLVYCTADFSTVKAVLCQQRVGLIIDARWLDADHLLFLQGNENEQAVYLFRPAEDMVELLYQSPEGRQILGIELDENGQPVCILSALPQLEEPDPTPAPEENGTDNTNSGTKSDESSGENPASNAKDWSSSLWDDEEDSEKSELGDANAGEESAIPTEKVELDMTAASPEPQFPEKSRLAESIWQAGYLYLQPVQGPGPVLAALGKPCAEAEWARWAGGSAAVGGAAPRLCPPCRAGAQRALPSGSLPPAADPIFTDPKGDLYHVILPPPYRRPPQTGRYGRQKAHPPYLHRGRAAAPGGGAAAADRQPPGAGDDHPRHDAPRPAGSNPFGAPRKRDGSGGF